MYRWAVLELTLGLVSPGKAWLYLILFFLCEAVGSNCEVEGALITLCKEMCQQVIGCSRFDLHTESFLSLL